MVNKYLRIFIVNTFSVWGSKIFQIVYFIFLTPIILSSLGSQKYGAWVLVGQFISYLTMLNLGVSSSITRYYARYLAKDDALSNHRLCSTAGFILAIVGIIVFLAAWFMRNGLVSFYGVEKSLYMDFVGALMLLALCMGATLPFRIFIGILQAYHRIYYVDLAIFVSTILRFLGVLYLKFYGEINLTTLAIVLLFSEFFKYLVMLISAKYFSTGMAKFSFKYVSWKMAKRIYSLGLASFSSSLLKMIRTQLPITLVGNVFGLALVPVISIPLSVLRNIGAPLGRVGTIFTALASELDAVGKKETIQFLNIEATKLLLFITSAIALLLAFFSRSILSFWLGESIDQNTLALTSKSLAIIVIPFFISISTSGINSTLMATGYHFKVVLTSGIITAICFCFFFVSMNKVTNVAFILSIPYLAISLYLVYLLSCYLKKSFLYVFKNIFLRPLFFVLLLAFTFYGFKGLLQSELLKLVFFCVMVILYFFMIIEQQHRFLILKALGFARNVQSCPESA